MNTTTQYVYKLSEPGLYTVGFYDPNNGKWIPESDHSNREAAAARVNYLSGGINTEIYEALRAWHHADRDGGVSMADFRSKAATLVSAAANTLFRD